MRITISGMPGSGKSTMAKKLCEKYNLKYYYMGKIQREIAKKKKISIIELGKFEEKNPEIDNEIDEFQKSLGKKDNILVDSRLGFFFIPNSIKIFLQVNLKEAAKRIMKFPREDEKFSSEEEAIKLINERINSENERYKKYYGLKNFSDEENYDLFLDTTNLSIEKVFAKIVEFIEDNYPK